MTYRRGDGVLLQKATSTQYVDRRAEQRTEIVLAVVTSVTRDGQIKQVRPQGYNQGVPPSRLGFSTMGALHLPQDRWDIEAVMQYCEARPWPHDPTYKGKQFDSVDEAREELRPFKRVPQGAPV
jgi:hypothetical protein